MTRVIPTTVGVELLLGLVEVLFDEVRIAVGFTPTTAAPAGAVVVADVTAASEEVGTRIQWVPDGSRMADPTACPVVAVNVPGIMPEDDVDDVGVSLITGKFVVLTGVIKIPGRADAFVVANWKVAFAGMKARRFCTPN